MKVIGNNGGVMKFTSLATALSICSLLSMQAAAAPIRVLIYSSCGDVGYVHAAISSGNTRLTTLLLNPAAAGLDSPIIPKDGFTVDAIGPSGGTASGGNGTTTDGHALIVALATHDVLILNSNTAIGDLFTSADKLALLAWGAKHGIVGFHGAADSHSLWPAWDSLTGGLFTKHNVAIATIHADSLPANVNDPDYKTLNVGLPKVNTFNEEWYSYQSNPRSAPGIHVLSTVDENTYTPDARMGDHPFSWYRTNPAGGRFFYTGAGHMQELFVTNQWFRRQAYNAILWAAGAATVSIRTGMAAESGASAKGSAEVSGASITVSFAKAGPHSLEILSLDGKRAAMIRGQGKQSHTIAGLKPNTVYAVLTESAHDHGRQLVKTQ